MQMDSTSGPSPTTMRAPAVGQQDPLEAVTQRLARRDQGQGVGHGRARSLHDVRMVPGAPWSPTPAEDGGASAGRPPLDAEWPERRPRASDRDVHELDPRRAVGTRGGDEGVAEADAGRLGQPPRGVGDLADLAAEARPRRRPPGRRAGAGPATADASARARARSAAGSVTRMPPTAEAKTSVRAERHPGALLEHGQQQRQPAGVHPLGRTPARRRPTAVRRRQGLDLDQQRPLALHGGQHGAARRSRAGGRRAAAGRGRSPRPGRRRPCRRGRAPRWGRSGASWPAPCAGRGGGLPRRVSTVSTRCSRARGPARVPSLVTWPTRTKGTRWVLARRTTRSAQARTWARLPGAPGAVGIGHGLDGVDDHQRRATCRAARRARPGQVGGRRGPGAPAGSGPEALGPQPDLGGRLLGRHEQHHGPGRGHDRSTWSSSVDFPTPGSPPEQGDRARDEAPAEHPVELGQPGGHGRRPGRVDVAEGDGTSAPYPRPARPRRRSRARRPRLATRRADGDRARPPRRGCSTRRRPGTARPTGRVAATARRTPVHRPEPCPHRRRLRTGL